MTQYRTRKTPPARPLDETLRSWLEEEGWTIVDRPEPDTHWAFGGEDSEGKRIGLVQPAKHSDSFIVQAAISYSDSDRARLDDQPHGVRDDLLWDIRFKLLDMELRFDGAEHPLQLISMSRSVYIEGLTKKEFMQEVARVYRGILAVLWLFQRHLGEGVGDDALPVM